MPTLADLIEALNRIEDKDQPYLGSIYLAEDFEIENQMPTYEQLKNIRQLRTYDKILTNQGQEFMDLVYEQMEEN
jgi:hypothetical protein